MLGKKTPAPCDALEDLISRLRPKPIEQNLVRVGPAGDGGYLVPDDLAGITACFSPGVDRITGFESDLAERGIVSFMVDGSIEKLPQENALFHFQPKYLGAVNSANTIRFEDWVEECAPGGGDDLLLQMDIEGAEYTVIADTPDAVFVRFRMMVIEFHGLVSLFSEEGFAQLKPLFDVLLQNFDVVHIHPNNAARIYSHNGVDIPDIAEFTFLRKDRVQLGQGRNTYPHPFDQGNLGHRPDLILPRCWQ